MRFKSNEKSQVTTEPFKPQTDPFRLAVMGQRNPSLNIVQNVLIGKDIHSLTPVTRITKGN